MKKLNQQQLIEVLDDVVSSIGVTHQIFIDLSDGEVWSTCEACGSSFGTIYKSDCVHEVIRLNSRKLPAKKERIIDYINYYAKEHQHYHWGLTLEVFLYNYGY